MSEASGKQWCARFPASNKIDDLAPPFRGDVQNLIQRTLEAGGSVDVVDTWRPAERAYLMHFCCEIAGYTLHGVYHQMKPQDVPPMPGVDIDWTHGGDLGAAISAVVAMRDTYGIVFPAALHSNHVKRTAVDMKVHIPKGATMINAQGTPFVFDHVADQTDPLFVRIAASYGVLHLAGDAVHFSIDGH